MADYRNIIPFIKRFEGGYVNHPNDKGGCTNMGVTISTFRQYYGRNKTCEDLRKLTEEQWQYIFKKGFWDRIQGDKIECQSVANMIADYVWASGVYGIKYVQKLLGVSADGVIGAKTLLAINSYPSSKELFERIRQRRLDHFDAIVKNNPSQKVFLKGWKRRVNSMDWVG